MTSRIVDIGIMAFCIATFLLLIPVAFLIELREERRD